MSAGWKKNSSSGNCRGSSRAERLEVAGGRADASRCSATRISPSDGPTVTLSLSARLMLFGSADVVDDHGQSPRRE